ncbi:hypothetical protein CMQ_1512 [Grosmannia clavigera kw1407]|uniref:DNA replication factor Cdt1 C-terminal domain-containing protein n=1 Tax=Grosmannia clavigera (strain kw1407 / UAMH 11150) TaxID=655863 RepID=F0XDJ9_GROCL|nr:uncharacterized protein CMQ_1512 [Grosmannia clavigera kw1407]EFX04584.1 hypothetical protein CMQ_1512 [Grosmannia clavigera kw1407]
MARSSRSTRTAAARPSNSVTTPAPVRSIDTFGRVSKRVTPSSTKKQAGANEVVAERFLAGQKAQKAQIRIELPALPSSKQPAAVSPAATPKSRKRRASESEQDNDASQKSEISSKRARHPRNTKAPSIAALLSQQKRRTSDASSSSDDGSDKNASHLLSRLNLQASLSPSPSVLPRSTSSSPRPASTAPTTPCESETEPDSCPEAAVLPCDLAELLQLQTSFAKALALHHAHHGTNAPVDLRVLCPSIAQAWGKRRVTREDIQRCIGVATTKKDTSALFLSDYGRGKICIELQPNAASTGTLSNQLNQMFETNLRALWSEVAGRDPAAIKAFIQNLPKAPVKKCTSLLQTSALRAKGQRTLEELMHGIALRKEEKEAREALLKAPVVVQAQPQATQQQSAQAPSVAVNADGTPMGLLDRIRYRQMQRTQQQTSGAAPPTPEELERRAALHRACDIAEVLSMLCTSSRQQNRVSFSMVAILTKLKDSLRLPISREEGAACVRLLAKEIAPQWIQIVSMGGREIVIMLTDFVPSKAAMQSRVQSLCQ